MKKWQREYTETYIDWQPERRNPEPEYKSQRGWRRAAWYVVNCLENWYRF